jgi:hypothetical protein
MLFSEDYRQPRVNLSYELIRIAVINHAGPQPLFRRRILPPSPRSANRRENPPLYGSVATLQEQSDMLS